MQQEQLKTRIFLFRSVDWILFLAVMAPGLYYIINSEDRFTPILVTLTGLFIVSKVGNYLRNKIALMSFELEKLEREARKNFN